MTCPLYQALTTFANEAVCPVDDRGNTGFVSGAFWGWGEARNQIAKILKQNPPGASAADAQLGYSIALQRAIEYHCSGLAVPAEIASDCPHHANLLNRLREVLEAHNRFHSKVGCPGRPECPVCAELEWLDDHSAVTNRKDSDL